MHADSYIYTQRDCTALLLRALRLFCVEISRHRLSTVMTGCIREQETASGELQGWVTSSWRVQINAFFSLCRFLAGRFAVVPLIPQALLLRDVWISPSLACYLGCVCPSSPAGKLTAFLLWNLTLMLSPGWFIKSQSCLSEKQKSGKTNGGVTQQEMWLRLGLMGFKVHPSHTVERLWGWQCAWHAWKCHIVSEKLPASHYIQTFLPSACSDAPELQRISLALQ